MWTIFLALCFSGGGAVIYHLNDSEYARMPPLFELDDYDTCLSEPSGLYCVAKFELYAEPDNQIMNMIREYSAVTSKHYNHSYIERGICVSRECGGAAAAVGAGSNANAVRAALETCVLEQLRRYDVRARLAHLHYCDTHATHTDIDTLDWAFAAVVAAFLVATLVATLYDCRLKNQLSKGGIGNKYVLSFSIIRNWQWLVSFETGDPRLKGLNGFHGARTVTNILMMLAHVLTLIATGFTDNPHDFEKTYENKFFIMCYNGMMIVQVFFCMSAFLLVHNLLLRSEANGISWKAVPVIMFLRFWRLIPAYALTIGFTATWFRFLGSGPLWNFFVTGSVTAECRQYWFYHLLFINNYMPDDKFCAVHSWYIGADTQLFFLGLLIYATTKSTTRKVVLAITLVVSLVLPAAHVWIQDLDGVMIMTPEFYRTMSSDNFRRMHVFGHNNISSYVVGMVTANLVYNWQKKGVDISKNKVFNAALWLVIPGIAAMFYSGRGFYADGERPSLLVRMLYASLHRLIIALIVAVSFVGFSMKCENTVVYIMEWRGWRVPARLAYSVYLLHFNLIYILQGTKRQLSPVSLQYLLVTYLGVIITSFALALPFFLIVEAPMNRLMKTILEPSSKMSRDGKIKKYDKDQ